jgi:putative transposase
VIRPLAELRDLVEPVHPRLSVRRQCRLLGLPRSSLYYQAQPPAAEDLALMRLLDAQYLRTPFYGVRRMTHYLASEGWRVNAKRVRRLLRLMGLMAIYPRPRLSCAGAEHRKYPYLLGDRTIDRPGQVWSMDITFIPMSRGWLYLAAVLDWFSRYVLSWRLSNSLEGSFCVEALEEALAGHSRPEIVNSDQGVQFSSAAFTEVVEGAGIALSMDGRGRALDNVFVERLWRTVKYEEVYLHDYADGQEAHDSLRRYWGFYNRERPHSSLGYLTPAAVHYGLEGYDREALVLRPGRR